MAQRNPSLAVDVIPGRMVFPCIGQPKLDGIRGMQMIEGLFTGRSLKPLANKALTKFWSKLDFYGLDGELVAPHLSWTDPALCRTTTSVTGTIDSKVIPNLVAFDLITGETYDKPYERRYRLLEKRAKLLAEEFGERIWLMPFVVLRNMDEFEEYVAKNRKAKYEGTIVRNPRATYKEGRSTLDMELWRHKDRIDFEVRVRAIIEAMQNNNEAKVNALGRTERSSHKANKTGKGMVGMIQGEVLKDVVWEKRVLFPKGMVIDVGPGELTHAQRKAIFDNPSKFIGSIGKVSVQPYGTKDKPRQPVWLVERNEVDL